LIGANEQPEPQHHAGRYLICYQIPPALGVIVPSKLPLFCATTVIVFRPSRRLPAMSGSAEPPHHASVPFQPPTPPSKPVFFTVTVQSHRHDEMPLLEAGRPSRTAVRTKMITVHHRALVAESQTKIGKYVFTVVQPPLSGQIM
jgi:hypothetical protein